MELSIESSVWQSGHLVIVHTADIGHMITCGSADHIDDINTAA